MDWGVFFIIEKLLKLRCLKWAHMTHLDIWNTSYSQKKGRESNWQFDSRPLKVENWPDLLTCRWHATCRSKTLDKSYNCLRPHFNPRSTHKVIGPKIVGVPILAISGLPVGSPETKCHLHVGLVERRIVYYKGEGVGFPQVRAVVNLMSLSCPWFILALKVLQPCTNHLVLVLCKPVWVSEACQFFLVPS